MPKFRIEELEDDNFDFNRLKLNEDELREFANKFLENRKKVWAKHGKYSSDDNIHLPYEVVLNHFEFLDEEIVSIAFSETNLNSSETNFNSIVGEKTKFYDYYIPKIWFIEKLYPVFSRYKFLANKFLLISSHFKSYSFAINIFRSGYVSIDDRINFLLNADLDKAERILCGGVNNLTLLTAEQSLRFLNAENQTLKLKIYKKVGVLNHLDSMLKEQNELIRELAASILDIGDPRFSLLLEEENLSVLRIAIKKCPEYMLPMFLVGNDRVKDYSDLKNIIKKRLSSATS